ncbi:MAG: hypothetical protein WC612_08150 [Bdellovibrionales bacterium]|jgi:hypothetical protein
MTRKTTAKRMDSRALLARGGFFALCFALMALFSFSGNQAQAQTQDPFAFGAKWVDLDAFEENQKKEEEDAARPIVEETKPPQLVASAVPVKAEPVRPLNLTSLPSIENNTQHIFPVESTEEDKEGFLIAQQNWKPFAVADQELSKEEEAAQLVHILGRDPFKVRFASLPSSVVKSIMASRVSTSALDREAQSNKAEKGAPAPVLAQKKVDPAVQKETNQACEAFTDYRRRQLEAMESDRKTLAALQSALTEMGLSKDLNFMTKTSSVLASQTQETTVQKGDSAASPEAVKTP